MCTVRKGFDKTCLLWPPFTTDPVVWGQPSREALATLPLLSETLPSWTWSPESCASGKNGSPAEGTGGNLSPSYSEKHQFPTSREAGQHLPTSSSNTPVPPPHTLSGWTPWGSDSIYLLLNKCEWPLKVLWGQELGFLLIFCWGHSDLLTSSSPCSHLSLSIAPDASHFSSLPQGGPGVWVLRNPVWRKTLSRI